jgi:hypothetical protein
MGYVVIVIVSGSWAGIESFMCQPIISVCPSSLCVLLAIVVGLPLSVPSIRRLWSKALVLNIALLIAGFVLLFFSQALGLNAQLIDPNTNETYYVGPHPVAVTLGYFLLVFSIVNWPFKPTPTRQDGEAVEPKQSDSE